MSESKPEQRKSKKGLWILLAIIAVVALPEIVAVSLHTIKWRPKNTTNNGELVVPVRPIHDVVLTTIDGKEIKFSEFHNKWTLMYFGDSGCSETCLKNIYNMRQVHAAQGKEQERVQRVLVLIDKKSIESLKAKLSDYPGMTVITGPEQSVATLVQQFTLPGATTADPHRIYLLDPMGNLIMSYLDSQDPHGIRKDLIHLLKNSWVG